METNGTGDKDKTYGQMPDNVFDRPGKPAPKRATPEEGCFTCLGGILLLLVSVAIWGYVYWRNNPEFHPEQSTVKPVVSPSPRAPGKPNGKKPSALNP